MKFDDLLDGLDDTLDENTGLFSRLNAAEPVAEILQKPVQSTSNPLYSLVDRGDDTYKPSIPDSELETLANFEVDFLMVKVEMYLGLGKGGVSELILTTQDKAKLSGDIKLLSEAEQSELLEKVRIKESFEKSTPTTRSQTRELLKQAVKADLIKKRSQGKLIIPSIESLMLRILISEFSELSAKNYGVFSSIGKNLVGKVMSIF
jgi:hypothetical protein